METFVSWFTTNGGTVDGSSMGLTEFPEQGFGAVALIDIPEGHVLFTIPRSLTLSMRTSELPGVLGVDSWRRFKLHKGWAGLMLCMMWEEAGAKGGSSKSGSNWGGYLESLPKTFDTPMFWTEQELYELKGSTLLDKIGKDQAELDYREKVLPALLSRPDIFDPATLASAYSLEKFHVTGSRILSRSFNVQPWDEQQDAEDREPESDPAEIEDIGEKSQRMDVDKPLVEEPKGEDEDIAEAEDQDDRDDEDEDEDDPADVAMVPMADMLNARYGSENAKLFHEPTELKMITTKAIKKGEQIYNTYGDLPNAELLRKYGHVDLLPLPPLPSASSSRDRVASTLVELGNPADVVEVPAVYITESVKAWYVEKKMELPDLDERIDWWLEEGGDDAFTLELSELLPDPFVSFSRLLLSPSSEWDKAREKGKPPKPKMDDVTRSVVRDVLERRVKMYPTSMEEDVSLLESDLPLNRRNAVIVRLGEKRILREALAALRIDKEQANTGAKAEKEKRKRQVDSEKGGKDGKKARR